jgi:hypothetical protein
MVSIRDRLRLLKAHEQKTTEYYEGRISEEAAAEWVQACQNIGAEGMRQMEFELDSIHNKHFRRKYPHVNPTA